MARLPLVDPGSAPPVVRETLEQLPVQLNIFRTMAHAETCFRPMLRLGSAILGKQQLDDNLRELAILHIAEFSKAEYEWTQHVPIAKASGVSEEQIAALARGDLAAGCFSRSERCVLDFTHEVVANVRASDESFERIGAILSAREIVELLIAIGFYMTIARLAETVGVEIDEAAGQRVAAATRE